jgi:hypothetical protein
VNSAWIYLAVLISLTVILSFFEYTFLGIVGEILTIVGASVAVCCCVTRNGWITYITLQSIALLLLILNLIVYGSIVSLISVILCLVGLGLASNTLRFMGLAVADGSVVVTQITQQPRIVTAMQMQPPPTYVQSSSQAVYSNHTPANVALQV